MVFDDDVLARTLTSRIRYGDVSGLAGLLAEQPSLAAERFGTSTMSRTALHIATDWPGHYPNVGEIIRLLVSSGAPLDGRVAGPHRETALHWAASSDDVAAINALLDAGADIEADGAVHTNGTPLSDAVVFAQWNGARLLVDRGATMTIWQAAALGETTQLRHLLATSSFDAADITNACWHACRAGQPGAARELAARGADIDWLGYDNLTSRQVGNASANPELIAWLQTN